MLDWIFEGIANWVASVMTQIMDAISGVFLDALGTDMTAMEEYFPFAVSAYTVIQYTAWAVLFLVVVWQLFRAFSGPLSETEEPLALLARGAIFAILIGYAKPIFSLVLDIGTSALYSAHGRDYGPGRLYICGNPADSYQWVGYHRICSHGGRTDFVDHFHDRFGMELL